MIIRISLKPVVSTCDAPEIMGRYLEESYHRVRGGGVPDNLSVSFEPEQEEPKQSGNGSAWRRATGEALRVLRVLLKIEGLDQLGAPPEAWTSWFDRGLAENLYLKSLATVQLPGLYPARTPALAGYSARQETGIYRFRHMLANAEALAYEVRGGRAMAPSLALRDLPISLWIEQAVPGFLAAVVAANAFQNFPRKTINLSDDRGELQ